MPQTKKKSFNQIKIHSQYSICEGAIKIENLKEYCKKNKIQSVGLSDTYNLSGALEFSENISSVGTQPIIGSQIQFKFKNTYGLIPLIAKNYVGYKNIIELSSKAYLKNVGNDQPHCSIDDLIKYSEGIIVLSGAINNLIGNIYNKGLFEELDNLIILLNNNFKDNFYLEIQRHGDQNEKQFEIFNLNLSNKYQIPIIATNEVYYLDKEMHDAHDALMCIGQKTYVNDQKRQKLTNNHYFKSSVEMAEIFKDLPEALENNYNLPFRCNFRPIPSKPILPNISSGEANIDDKLKKDSLNGLEEKFKADPELKSKISLNNKIKETYKYRLNHEIKIITEMNYSGYFLIVSDYIKWAKNNNIPVGPGRGSGAGSLVAWCLSITDVDPIKFNLIFERFLNPDRISMPDFDIDFCEEKRDQVFKYLTTKYKDSVAHIITFGKLKARMVIRDVGRVLGLPYGFIDSICKMIPFDPSRPLTLQESINIEPRLQKLINEDKRVSRLIELSLKLEGLNRNVATHAAGVVISDKKLTETVPLYKDSSTDLLLPSTQFDMYSAENAGLVKFDFLGLKTLTVINKTQKLVSVKDPNFIIETINYEDQKVYDLLSNGKTVGLFQLESSGMKDALINMKPNHLEDIIALVALYRPGPMSNIPVYNECKHGKREPDYLHPKLIEILKPTYGVIIYQEQVMQIAQELSGFTAGEADILRRAMGKKKRAELEKQKERFVEGAYNNGISKDIAAGIFLKIEPFAEYGFNKSHAAAYAIIAYQTAYLKTYHPHEFFAASMSMELSNQKKLSEFYEELKRLNINIIRPDINKCDADFSSDGINFLYALGAIKSVGFEAISKIVKERKNNGDFKDLTDFINRVNPKDINKLQLEGLVKAGAFDNINSNRQSLFNSIPNIILKSKNIFENNSVNQIDLFKEDSDETYIENIDDWNVDTKLSKEFETLGFFVSDHPLNQYKSLFNQYNIIEYDEFNTNENILSSNIASTILKVQEKKTQKGTSYAIIKFSDLSGVFELFVFSDIFETNRDILTEGNSVMITLVKNYVDESKVQKKINIRKIISMKEVIDKPIEEVKIKIKNLEDIQKINKLGFENGNTKVNIDMEIDNKTMSFQLNKKRKIDHKMLNLLKNEENIEII
ncbi:DNA polymerase III subunit alpha [Pelagibacterales bacterium SAG-MED17]|nr:DNA polymerase III subunit alpha [Pelagibacterales bacterium SAG-MED17]